MKTAFRIASAALALAAIVSLPFSQPAQAAGGFDLKPEIVNWASKDGQASISVQVHNLGSVNAGMFTAMYYCDYMMDNGKVERVNQGAVPVPGTVYAGDSRGIPAGGCGKYQGRAPFLVGVVLAAPGDINNGNNRAEKKFI